MNGAVTPITQTPLLFLNISMQNMSIGDTPSQITLDKPHGARDSKTLVATWYVGVLA